MSEVEQVGGLVPVPAVPDLDVVAVLRSGIAAADREAQRRFEEADLRGLLVGVHGVDQLLGDLRQLRERSAHYAGTLMPKRTVVEEGLPAVERSHPTTTTWDDGVLAELAQRARFDETGEERTAEEAVGELVRLVRLCGTVTWRKGGTARSFGLRDVGVDPDAYCDTVKSNRWHIRFVGGGW